MSNPLIQSISIEEEKERESHWLNVYHHVTNLEQANDLWRMEIDTSKYSEEDKEDIAVSFGKFRTPFMPSKTLEGLRNKIENLDLLQMLYRAVLITIPSKEYSLHSKETLRSQKNYEFEYIYSNIKINDDALLYRKYRPSDNLIRIPNKLIDENMNILIATKLIRDETSPKDILELEELVGDDWEISYEGLEIGFINLLKSELNQQEQIKVTNWLSQLGILKYALEPALGIQLGRLEKPSDYYSISNFQVLLEATHASCTQLLNLASTKNKTRTQVSQTLNRLVENSKNIAIDFTYYKLSELVEKSLGFKNGKPQKPNDIMKKHRLLPIKSSGIENLLNKIQNYDEEMAKEIREEIEELKQSISRINTTIEQLNAVGGKGNPSIWKGASQSNYDDRIRTAGGRASRKRASRRWSNLYPDEL